MASSNDVYRDAVQWDGVRITPGGEVGGDFAQFTPPAYYTATPTTGRVNFDKTNDVFMPGTLTCDPFGEAHRRMGEAWRKQETGDAAGTFQGVTATVVRSNGDAFVLRNARIMQPPTIVSQGTTSMAVWNVGGEIASIDFATNLQVGGGVIA